MAFDKKYAGHQFSVDDFPGVRVVKTDVVIENDEKIVVLVELENKTFETTFASLKTISGITGTLYINLDEISFRELQ